MLYREAIVRTSEILKNLVCFYIEINQLIYRFMVAMYRDGNPIDILTFWQKMQSVGVVIDGGAYYLSRLSGGVVSSANTEEHCRIVYEKYLLREQIRISGEVLLKAYELGTDAFELLDQTEAAFSSLSNDTSQKEAENAGTIAIKAINEIDAKSCKGSDLVGINTGFKSINRLTAGWQAPDLIILAARPSVGKTALALNFAKYASESGCPTAFFSLEMSSEQLMQRLLSCNSEVPMDLIHRGKLNDTTRKKIMASASQMQSLPLYFDDSAALSIFELRAKIRRLRAKHDIRFVIVDYLQLMSGYRDRNSNREQEISTISRGLKALAKEENIAIMALSQMSRAIESAKREPMLSDLRESGAIEQDADVVIFAWRDDYQQIGSEKDPALDGQTWLKWAKHRNGMLDKISMRAELSIQKFYDPMDEMLPDTQSELGDGSWTKVDNENKEENPF